MKKFLALALFACISYHSFALSVGAMADSAYNKENYREAIDLYLQSIATEGKSSTAYYNLGNAYFRNDNLGKAVVYYERALRLDPTNADARQNLDFVRSRIQDRPEDDTPFFSTIHHKVISSFAPNTWAWLTFILFVVLVGAAALYLFSHNIALRKTGFFGGIVLMCVFVYTLLVSFDAATISQSHESAVVIVPNTQLSSAPRASRTSSDKVVTIHEGTKVEIVDSVATPDDPISPQWFEVKINNGTRAWLRAVDVERI